MDPRLSVLQAWGCTEVAVQVQPGQLYGAVLEEQVGNTIVATDVCLFVPEIEGQNNSWWGKRYEIPTAFVPMQDVLLQVPSRVRLTGEYTFYEVPAAAKWLEALAESLEVGEFRTEYMGPDLNLARLMIVVKARGRATADEIIADLRKAAPDAADTFSETWLQSSMERLQREGYGLWRSEDGYYYVSARPDKPAAYYKRAVAKARNLARTVVPPYITAAQAALQNWVRVIAREEAGKMIEDLRRELGLPKKEEHDGD